MVALRHDRHPPVAPLHCAPVSLRRGTKGDVPCSGAREIVPPIIQIPYHVFPLRTITALLLAVLLLPGSLHAHTTLPGGRADTTASAAPGAAPDWSWYILPNLFYTPETKIAGGVAGGVIVPGALPDRPSSVLVQGAYRFPVWWRFKGAVFASVGEVGSSVQDLSLDHLAYAAGAGLRFLLNPAGIHIRADYAVGQEGGALYFTLREAF